MHSPPTKFSYPTVNSTTSPLALSTVLDQGKGNSNRQKQKYVHPSTIYIYGGPLKGAETDKRNNIKALQLQPDTTLCAKFVWSVRGSTFHGLSTSVADAVDILQDHWTTYNFWSTSNTAQPHSHVTLYCNHNLDGRRRQPTKFLEA